MRFDGIFGVSMDYGKRRGCKLKKGLLKKSETVGSHL
jgi:hypothetical protein